jgi:ABC-type glycerol-3-phosphate transport system substrate-binding protein
MIILKRIMLALAVAAILAACGPEDGRPRGAGAASGADVNNRPANFQPKSKVFGGNAP